MDYQKLNLLFKFNKEFSHKKIRLQDLSDTECMISTYIYSHENCSQDEVANALKIDKTTVGKALSCLERKGCVLRLTDSEDKRIKRLFLTDTGRIKVSKLLDIHNNWLHSIMSVLSATEQQQFEDYCDRLLAAAKEFSGRNTLSDR